MLVTVFKIACHDPQECSEMKNELWFVFFSPVQNQQMAQQLCVATTSEKHVIRFTMTRMSFYRQAWGMPHM